MAHTTSSRALHIGLWLAQILLAAMFLVTGSMKALQPITELAPNLPWVLDVPASLVRFIGVSELLGGLGLLLPSLLRIRPSFTPLAAIGLVVLMVLASLFHLFRGEAPVIGINLTLAAIAGFIAWGRSKKAPIQPK